MCKISCTSFVNLFLKQNQSSVLPNPHQNPSRLFGKNWHADSKVCMKIQNTEDSKNNSKGEE